MGRRGLGFTAGCWLARRVPDCIDLSLYRTVLHLYELYMYNMGMRGGGQTARLRTDSDWAACPYAFPPIVRRLLSAVTNALKERREQLETHPQAAFCWRKIVDGENSIQRVQHVKCTPHPRILQYDCRKFLSSILECASVGTD